jgi:hypothetical protein
MCRVWLSEGTVTFALYIINSLVSIIEEESVYCAERTESLYIRNTDTSRPSSVNHCSLYFFHIDLETLETLGDLP